MNGNPRVLASPGGRFDAPTVIRAGCAQILLPGIGKRPTIALSAEHLGNVAYAGGKAWPNDADVLLKAVGLKTAILSNGSPDMLGAAVNKAGIGHLIDAVLSVDWSESTSRTPKVYQLAVDRLAIPAGTISFQSSNAWDAYAASAFGSSGATATASGRSGCREPRIARSPLIGEYGQG